MVARDGRLVRLATCLLGEFRFRLEAETNIAFGALPRTQDTFTLYRYMLHFDLRYRRPAPSSRQLVLRGRLLRSEGRDHWGEGEIALRDGTLLTTASARWREIPPRAR